MGHLRWRVTIGGEVRYWKGAYDEDRARDRDIRRARGVAADEEESEVCFFHALVAVQILMITVALFSVAEWLVSSR